MDHLSEEIRPERNFTHSGEGQPQGQTRLFARSGSRSHQVKSQAAAQAVSAWQTRRRPRSTHSEEAQGVRESFGIARLRARERKAG